MSLDWAEASYEKIWAMVYVRVATFARYAAVAVARFAKDSTVSDWWSDMELKASTALARGKCCPAVRRKFAFHSRCTLARCSLKFFQSQPRGASDSTPSSRRETPLFLPNRGGQYQQFVWT